MIENLFAGDLIDMSIALSWMILGDGGLARNDEKLRRQLPTHAKPSQSIETMALSILIQTLSRPAH